MQNNQPSRRMNQTGRMAFYLAAFISLSAALPALVQAEGGNDLNITKDGSDVNVHLNNASSSDVSIRRSDDIMIIKVPKSYKGGVSIDPALKKNSVVQEMETPNGRAITIQSQQIYLHTSDGDGGSTPASATHAAKEEKADSKSEEKATKDDPIPGNAGFLQLSSPTESKTGIGNSVESGHSNSQQSRHEKRHHHNSAPAQPAPLDITRLLEQSSLLSEPFGSAPGSHGRSEHHTVNHRQDSEINAAIDRAVRNTKTHGKHKHGKAEQLEDASAGNANEDSEATNGDPEMQPLEDDNVRQAAAIQASINGMLRIFFSLLLVLGMIFGFVKVVLPKLLERYPDFFEKLKERRQWSTEMPTQLINNWNKPSTPKAEKKHSPKPSEKPKDSPISISALAEQFLNATLPEPTPPVKAEPPARQSVAPSVPASPRPITQSAPEPATKKNYLERLKVAGEYFQVLQSTILGKGKELHLVELQGKQFLVATTPYTVTLLKDLSEEAPTASQPASVAPAVPPTQARRITQQSSIPQFPSQPVRPQTPRSAQQTTGQSQASQPAQSEVRSEVRSETIAYLSDETPIRRVNSTAKPYATPPGPNQQARKKSNIPQFPAATVEDDYPTYLTKPQSQPIPQSNQPTRPQPAMAGEHPHTAQSHQPAYIDAEEVVVLEDYDDIYGH